MNILVYLPKSPRRRLDLNWIYGIDIVEQLRERHPEWTFVIADGSRPENKFFEGIDAYLRPTRCDGWGIMAREAKHCGIPTIWSFETGDYIEPDIDNLERRLIEIKKMVS